MPDIERKSISASQAAALLDASPYITRWMLYRWLKYGDPIHSPGHNRMDWGTRMEPECLKAAGEDLALEIIPTRLPDGTQPYVRNGLLGCTRDAEIIVPDRGRGAFESKCVFDIGVWMQEWGGGTAVPRHVEIQLQTQMLVGDGENSYGFGYVSAWHCAEQKYFERKPIPELWAKLREEAARLFDDIEHDREPDPFGSPVESPLLAEVYPTVVGKTLDLSAPTDAAELARVMKIAEDTRMLEWHAGERLGHQRAEKELKARAQAIAGDHDLVKLPYGILIKVKEQRRAGYTVGPTTFRVIDTFVPNNIPDDLLGAFEKASFGG